jgi:hypothetical protein
VTELRLIARVIGREDGSAPRQVEEGRESAFVPESCSEIVQPERREGMRDEGETLGTRH